MCTLECSKIQFRLPSNFQCADDPMLANLQQAVLTGASVDCPDTEPTLLGEFLSQQNGREVKIDVVDGEQVLAVSNVASQALFWLLDTNAEEANDPNRLANIAVDGLVLTVKSTDGTSAEVVLRAASAQTAGTHEQFVAALQPPLQVLIDEGTLPAGTTLTLDNARTKTSLLDSGQFSQPIPAFVVTIGDDSELCATTFSQVDTPGNFNVFGVFQSVARQLVSQSDCAAFAQSVGQVGAGNQLLLKVTVCEQDQSALFQCQFAADIFQRSFSVDTTVLEEQFTFQDCLACEPSSESATSHLLVAIAQFAILNIDGLQPKIAQWFDSELGNTIEVFCRDGANIVQPPFFKLVSGDVEPEINNCAALLAKIDAQRCSGGSVTLQLTLTEGGDGGAQRSATSPFDIRVDKPLPPTLTVTRREGGPILCAPLPPLKPVTLTNLPQQFTHAGGLRFTVDGPACSTVTVSELAPLIQCVDCDGKEVSCNSASATCQYWVRSFVAVDQCGQRSDVAPLTVYAVVVGGPCFQCPPDRLDLSTRGSPKALLLSLAAQDQQSILDNGIKDGCGRALTPEQVCITFRDKVLCDRCCRRERSVERTWSVHDKQCNRTATCVQQLRVTNPCWQKYFPGGGDC